MTGYYDYVLGLIPAALFGVTAILSVLGIPLASAVPVGGGVSALVVGHALFVNGPVDDVGADVGGDVGVTDAPAQSGATPNAD